MNERPLGIRVECHADDRSEEAPRRFFVGDRAVGVSEILDRWLSPQRRDFKLRGDDGGIYILRHDLGSRLWELILYDSGQAEATRLSST